MELLKKGITIFQPVQTIQLENFDATISAMGQKVKMTVKSNEENGT